MPSDWKIEHWPRCGFHVFLSHCAEDREALILPVREELEKKGILTWVDRHNYPLGRDPYELLQDEILRCRHVVYFITRASLRQGRGWSAVEKAYAAVIQRELHFRGDVVHFELPLFFVTRDDETFRRSIWRTIQDRGLFFGGSARARKKMVAWAVDRISTFVTQEQIWAQEIADRIDGDEELAAIFKRDRHLYDRIIAADPPPIPN